MNGVRARRSLLGVAVAALLLAFCLTAAGWRITGGRWFVVRTPSMGQAAPVGTLLLTRPTSVAKVDVGDIVSFHPPNSGLTYTHRVIAKTAAGLRTRGDVNPAPDPWVLTDDQLIGAVSYRLWGLGWVLRTLPLLLLCLAVLWFGTALLPFAWRSPLRQAGTALSLAITSAILHPWVGVQQLDVTGTGRSVRIRVVSTGVLPIHLTSHAGSNSGRLLNGQVGTVLVRQPDTLGGYHLTPSLDLSVGWWIVLVAVCLTPLAWALLVGSPARPVPDDADTSDDLPQTAAAATDPDDRDTVGLAVLRPPGGGSSAGGVQP